MGEPYPTVEPDGIALTPLVSTGAMLHKATSLPNDVPVIAFASHEEHPVSMSITPSLSVNGKPAAVLPVQVVWTDWEGHDAADVAACLSGALLKSKNVSLLVSPTALKSSDDLQQTVAGMASSLGANLLSKILPTGGTGAVFTSSMYKGGPKLSARELKSALTRHYASLLQLPSCMHVPEAAARWARQTAHNIVAMVTGTTNYYNDDVIEHKEDFVSMAEAAVLVEQIVNEKHPELCTGVEGSSFRLRLAGFSGPSARPKITPDHIWVYAAVEEATGLCTDTPASPT
jgi:hypothetical protein